MSKDTIKFDAESATSIYQKVENIATETESVILSCKNKFESTIEFYKGKSRKPYEEEAESLFDDFEDIIEDAKDMAQSIKEAASAFMEYDKKQSKFMEKR